MVGFPPTVCVGGASLFLLPFFTGNTLPTFGDSHLCVLSPGHLRVKWNCSELEVEGGGRGFTLTFAQSAVAALSSLPVCPGRESPPLTFGPGSAIPYHNALEHRHRPNA